MLSERMYSASPAKMSEGDDTSLLMCEADNWFPNIAHPKPNLVVPDVKWREDLTPEHPALCHRVLPFNF